MPFVIWNMDRVEIPEVLAACLSAAEIIYDPFEGDPEAEGPEGETFYPSEPEEWPIRRFETMVGAYRKASRREMTLDEALDVISVMECDEMNDACDQAGMGRPHVVGWWGVCDEDGVNAYFSTEAEALRHRLDLVRRRVNGWV